MLNELLRHVSPQHLEEILEFSNYPRIVKQIYAEGLEDQFLFVSFEDGILKSPEVVISKVMTFLGVTIQFDNIKVTAPVKNQRVSKEICYINSKLLKVKKMRKFTQIINDIFKLKPYQIEEDDIGKDNLLRYLGAYNWSQIDWNEVFGTKEAPAWDIFDSLSRK